MTINNGFSLKIGAFIRTEAPILINYLHSKAENFLR
jgi:hypothetical protein